ncbi:MAG: transcription termination/antitermination protein NusG [Clostridiales bacterium]|nr:transcription termination/antitermination protein NusG [Clostridiales bacterium]
MEMDTEAKWYVLHTMPGYENVAKENLERVVEKNNITHRVFDIVIPMEDAVEEKNGKKVIVTRKLMPTYLFVKMIYGDDIWHRIVGTRGITGFVGPKGRPLELPDEDIVKMRLEKTEVDITIEIGDQVEILDGALKGQIGSVVEINKEQLTAKVSIEMFGRENFVDVNLDEIRKIN